MHLGGFLQLLPWNPALLGRVCFHEAAVNQQVLALDQSHFHALPARIAAMIPSTRLRPSSSAWPCLSSFPSFRFLRILVSLPNLSFSSREFLFGSTVAVMQL